MILQQNHLIQTNSLQHILRSIYFLNSISRSIMMACTKGRHQRAQYRLDWHFSALDKHKCFRLALMLLMKHKCFRLTVMLLIRPVPDQKTQSAGVKILLQGEKMYSLWFIKPNTDSCCRKIKNTWNTRIACQISTFQMPNVTNTLSQWQRHQAHQPKQEYLFTLFTERQFLRTLWRNFYRPQ